MRSQPAHRLGVELLRPQSQSGQGHVLDHPRTQWRHGGLLSLMFRRAASSPAGSKGYTCPSTIPIARSNATRRSRSVQRLERVHLGVIQRRQSQTSSFITPRHLTQVHGRSERNQQCQAMTSSSPFLRPDCGVRTSSPCVPVLSLHVSGLCARNGFNVGSRNCAGCCRMGILGRALGRLRLERWQR